MCIKYLKRQKNQMVGSIRFILMNDLNVVKLVVDGSGKLFDISMLQSKIMPALSKPGRKIPI